MASPVPNRDREGADGTPSPRKQGPLPDGRGSERAGGSERVGGHWPQAYLVTCHTYGTWLHGDARGSVDRDHNVPGTPVLVPNENRRVSERRSRKGMPVLLNAPRRDCVRRTVHEVADHRDWTVHTLNVRTNHVHVVVGAPEAPERVMNTIKSWSTRRLVEAGLVAADTRVWARHGSTRYLWTSDQLEAACVYVRERQGVDLDGGV